MEIGQKCTRQPLLLRIFTFSEYVELIDAAARAAIRNIVKVGSDALSESARKDEEHATNSMLLIKSGL